MTKMIRIENLERRPFAFNLYHSEVCEAVGECFCTEMEVALKGGRRGTRLEPRHVRIPSFGSPDGGMSEDLPEAVVKLGPVATRLAMKTVRVRSLGGYAPVEVVPPE